EFFEQLARGEEEPTAHWILAVYDNRTQWSKLLEPARPRPAALSATIPQPTFIEARNAAIALADGPDLRFWEVLLGEVGLRHAIPGQRVQTKLVPGALLDWFALPATVD